MIDIIRKCALAMAVLFTILTATTSAQDLSGSWNGMWLSGANSHRGRLSATFCQTNSNQVQARFRGTFAKVIPFRYRANLNVVHQQPGLTVLSGARKLPLAGEFRYYATITDGCFQGKFSSGRNYGHWTLQRQ